MPGEQLMLAGRFVDWSFKNVPNDYKNVPND